ncbi:hypothetical protein ACJ73_07602 [Blastomyces percursus]|uniref:Uncharacterized protein n=1 Tax=Blastomyces percursus TaxID=1658174 RepID=A0A1J9R0G4_9EURO|nr:hypothetical protein ACJ73_07602 [Blastomyces percursus]
MVAPANVMLRTCLKSTTIILQDCPAQDWDCLCTQYGNVLTCYNNCPTDPGRFAVESSKVANCNAAKQFGTARSSASAPKPTATQASGTAGNGGSHASQTSGAGKPTGTGPASETETPNVAPAMVVSGVEMGLGGLVWMLIAWVGYLM